MADDTTPSRQDNPARGGQPPGNREPGGFRIRLSDNEMRAARAVQEAFQLRSTVAALGLSIRTVAQLLEDGKLDELVAQQRAQAGPPRSQDGEGRSRENRGAREERGAKDERGGRGDRSQRANPFARPSKPAAPVAEPSFEPAEATDLPEATDLLEATEVAEAIAAVEATPEANTPKAKSDDTANADA